MDNWKLLRFIDDKRIITYREIVRLFLKDERSLTPALDIELSRYLKQGLIKVTRGPIKDFNIIHPMAKGMRLCRLLNARDRIDTKIKEHLSR